jgi:predicted dehydrogenase
MNMASRTSDRRSFLKTSSGVAAAALAAPYFFTGARGAADDAKAESKNDRPLVGCIGTGDRWHAVGRAAMKFGDVVAVCDVDRQHAENGQRIVKDVQGREVEAFEDYRKVLDRKDVDIVTIVTPDHWHTKIAIEALQAGKDVYCEKPLTLTIEEGRQIVKVMQQTNRVFQVGTQQRSEMGLRFLKAVALVKEGRLGTIKSVQCAIGGAPSSGPIPKVDPPSHLNWEMWLGQAPLVDYRYQSTGKKNDRWGNSRCHYEFRWWYEYSGGKMTDWGAHHVDIAQWAIGMDHTGPISVEGTATHPVELKNGHPTDDSQYNSATEFLVTCRFANGVEMVIRHDTDNGILIEGDKGRIFVSRGALRGKPVEDLEQEPLPEDAIQKVYKGREPGDHMRNFFECVKAREQPISDVYTHHRAMTTCHLANIAIRLGRPLKWDPEREQIVADADANAWLSREQRKGYEIKV